MTRRSSRAHGYSTSRWWRRHRRPRQQVLPFSVRRFHFVNTATASELLVNQLWYQTKARTVRLLRGEASTARTSITKHPQDLVELIISHFTYDRRSLLACSLTCHSWYIAAASHPHHSLTTEDKPPLFESDKGHSGNHTSLACFHSSSDSRSAYRVPIAPCSNIHFRLARQTHTALLFRTHKPPGTWNGLPSTTQLYAKHPTVLWSFNTITSQKIMQQSLRRGAAARMGP